MATISTVTLPRYLSYISIFACIIFGNSAYSQQETDNRESNFYAYKDDINKEKRVNLNNVGKMMKLANDLYIDGLLSAQDMLETVSEIHAKIDSEYMFDDNGDAVESLDYIESLVTNDEFINKLQSIAPSPKNTLTIAKIHYVKGDKTKACTILEGLLKTINDVNKESEFLENFSRAISAEPKTAIKYANMAIDKNPGNGMAYIALGKAYMNIETCGDDMVSKKSVYWLATDKFLKAKQQDQSISTVDLANKAIRECAKNYPSQSDAFYLGILNGQKYKVNCGDINEETIVRTVKH